MVSPSPLHASHKAAEIGASYNVWKGKIPGETDLDSLREQNIVR